MTVYATKKVGACCKRYLFNRRGKMKIHARTLNDTDFSELRALLLKEGRNEWNYLTEESIDHQLRLIKEGKAVAVLAEDREIFGFAVLILKNIARQNWKNIPHVHKLHILTMSW